MHCKDNLLMVRNVPFSFLKRKEKEVIVNWKERDLNS